MERIIPIAVLICAVIALIFAAVNFYSVKKKPEGTEQMATISSKHNGQVLC